MVEQDTTAINARAFMNNFKHTVNEEVLSPKQPGIISLIKITLLD